MAAPVNTNGGILCNGAHRGSIFAPRESGQTSTWSTITRKSGASVDLAERKMELFNNATAQETTNGGKTSYWNLIDWDAVTQQVRTLQTRIVKAMKQGKAKHVRSLQRLLLHSTAARLLAVRRVTSNRGKRTAGVDGILWNTPEAKYTAAIR